MIYRLFPLSYILLLFLHLVGWGNVVCSSFFYAPSELRCHLEKRRQNIYKFTFFQKLDITLLCPAIAEVSTLLCVWQVKIMISERNYKYLSFSLKFPSALMIIIHLSNLCKIYFLTSFCRYNNPSLNVWFLILVSHFQLFKKFPTLKSLQKVHRDWRQPQPRLGSRLSSSCLLPQRIITINGTATNVWSGSVPIENSKHSDSTKFCGPKIPNRRTEGRV